MILEFPAWKNGSYCQVRDLTVSILDFGLIHCDATYDVLHVKNGEIQNLKAHIDRFTKCCYQWRIPLKYSDEQLIEVFNQLISKAPTKDLLLWIGITRGTPTSGNPRDLLSCVPNVFAYVKPYYGFNADNTATVCLAKQIRNDSFDQRMKNFSWNDLNLAQWEAIDRGYDTCILTDRNGYITEGPGFNVGFISKDDFVYAPKYNRLQGTVMELVRELCESNNKQFFYTDITPSCVDEDMCAMFLTSTAGNVIEVKCFEGRYFKDNETLKWLQQNI